MANLNELEEGAHSMGRLATAPIRITRPTGDLAAAERFWRDGVGLDVLWHTDAAAPDHKALTMVGAPGAMWHLELVDDPESATNSAPSGEDLLVIYLGEEPDPAWLERILSAGGQHVPSLNPYWDTWGLTIVDPDGYRLVLCTRTWE